MTSNPKPSRSPRLAALAILAVLTLGGCASASSESAVATSSVTTAAQTVAEGTGVWDATTVHDISIEVDESAVATMITTYLETEEKEWIEATVTIDGEVYDNVGLRLKGNSSLRGVSADADAADLPWLIRLDKFVDGQQLDGSSEFIVRSNNSETALNEAVALDLLADAGLASEHAIATSFTVNDGDARLRLVVQNLDEAWEEENFTTDGILYKAEAGGDWTYRGDDPDSYADVFDQETGDDDLTPLIDFLEFINTSERRRVRGRTVRAARRGGVRALPRLRGGGRQLRRHRRSRQQLLPALRRRVRRVHRRGVGPQPGIRWLTRRR